jgi:hypothetical protein
MGNIVPGEFISDNFTFCVVENSRFVNNVGHEVEQKPHYCNSGESATERYIT